MTPTLMGIVNVTPDSFSDGGKFIDPERAIAHGLKLLQEGATILDIGGESTRPGSAGIETAEEIRRVVPVIQELSKHATISIDSYRPETIAAALAAGATFINDITALENPASLALAAAAKVPVCLMHMQGTPRTMQQNPVYHDAVGDVMTYLRQRIDACLAAGIVRELLVIDVGIGFGKTLDHNLALLRNLSAFKNLGVKILLGTSRKSFIEKLCPGTPADQRLPGSLATALWGCDNGADILRVHDVAETVQAVTVWQAMSGQPGSMEPSPAEGPAHTSR